MTGASREAMRFHRMARCSARGRGSRTCPASTSPARWTRSAPEVTDLRVGDAVVGSLPLVADGASAEYVVAPAERPRRRARDHPARRRGRRADGRTDRVAGPARARRGPGRAACARQRRRRGGRRLRRAARQARRRGGRRDGEPAQRERVQATGADRIIDQRPRASPTRSPRRLTWSSTSRPSPRTSWPRSPR